MGLASEIYQFNQYNGGTDIAMPGKLTLTKNFGVKTSTEYSWTMEKIKAIAQEIRKMSILYPKTSKKLYHHIRFQESIMKNEVFYKKAVFNNFLRKNLRWSLFLSKRHSNTGVILTALRNF